MDARRKKILASETHDYIFENWILTEAFIEKIKTELCQIKDDDSVLDDTERAQLLKTKKELAVIERERPRFSFGTSLSLFSGGEKQKRALPELPLEIQVEILSKLPFMEKQRLNVLAKHWKNFFDQQTIEREYIFPKKSGGLIMHVKNKKPCDVKELLAKTKQEVIDDIGTEMFNILTLKNKRRIDRISQDQVEGLEGFYKLLIPLLLIAYVSYNLDYYKITFSAGAFLLLPAIHLVANKYSTKQLTEEPTKVREKVHQYFTELQDKQHISLRR